ncbi:hypothetical protein [Agromyces sp. NPDC058064]|uniref:hypothetical protein n=1 Tax=Agromyces sp. NPDC058064 TaxID=3346322 RepID=UPI0036DD5A63
MRRHLRSRSAAAARSRTDPSHDLAATHAAPIGDERAVISGYRLLRRLASGDRAGVYLASSLTPAEGGSPPAAPVALRIYEAGCDDARVAVEISAMTADATGTLPALIDVTALDDGRCVLAVERVGGPTLARLLTERALEPGEAVTILAPIAVAVAGLAEAGFVHTRLAPNDVLIDGVGRPRLIGLGAVRRLDEVSSAIERTELLREGHAALSQLVAVVAEATRPRGSLDRAVAAIRDAAAARPFVRSEALLERTLFESAAASPVRGVIAVAGHSSSWTRPPGIGEADGGGHVSDPQHVASPGASTPATAPEPPARPGLLRTLAALAQLPADAFEHGARLADADPMTSLVARLRRALAARRRAVLVAALAGGAALVLLLAFVPPADTGAAGVSGEFDAGASASNSPVHGPGAVDAAADGVGESEAGSGEADVPAGTVADEAQAEGGAEREADPVAATRALLALREDCLGSLDAACLGQVAQAGSAIERADLAALSGAREGAAIAPGAFALDAVAIMAEMGDAVLMTVPYTDPEREPASLLVMRSEAGWRLRELFD